MSSRDEAAVPYNMQYNYSNDREQEDFDEEGEPVGYDNDEEDDEDEEEEEEDEEEARKVAEGFIVDDEEEEEQDSDDSAEVTVRRKKRKKVEAFAEELDEEDLDLLEENTGVKLARSTGPKLKRLKRGREEPSFAVSSKSVEKIFSDEEEEAAARDDLNDFIADEDDDLDEVLGDRYRDDRTSYYDNDRARRPKAGKGMMEMLPEGLSEDAVMDMYDIFGDGGDYEWALYDDEPLEANKHENEPQLADIFEPSELAERMLTEEDEVIRLTDVPERLQMRYEGLKKTYGEVDMSHVQEEGDWIARQLARNRGLEQPTEKFTTAVTYVVGFFIREFLEVPHIKDHRRDFFTEIDKTTGATTEILTNTELWDIYDLDFKYHSFRERKTTLKEFLARCFIRDDYIDEMSSKVEKAEEITDLTDYVNFKFSDNVNTRQQQSNGPKRPSNKSLYELSQKTKVPAFLPKFGITAQELGANYLNGNRRYYPEDNILNPEDEAQNYVDGSFPDHLKVLKAAKSVLAQEIGYDPQMRKAMRRDWEINAVVNVKPTEKGTRSIGDLHPMHPFKYLREKPVSSFRDGQFLYILKGESDGLLSVTITVPNYNAWFNKIAEYYLSDGYSDTVQQWNDQRKEILEQALKEYLVPMMDKYIREQLRVEAQEHICKAASWSLQSKINVGPFRGPDADRYKNGIPRVIAVSSGNGGPKDPTMAVFVNHRGKVLDHIQVPHLKDEQHWKTMLEFIKSRKPNVVALSGYTAETRRVLKHMQTMVGEINQSKDSGAGTVDLVVVNDEAARLYKNSKRAEEEFGELHEVVRYCISLARRLQNPVLEYVGLGRDLLALRHHEHQHLVPEDLLLFYLERALINVVNDFGVDINAAIHSPYIANALQYVCGFGPRKAQSILKKIDATGELESRTALVLRKLTPANTFMNCASYLRIRDVDGADILDDTRIHPQDYELARKMAGDALEIDEDEMDDYDSKVAIVTRVIKEYPDKLNDLILDDYAVVLRQQYNAPKRQILEHIKLELQGPYHDRRQRYSRPSMEETFVMVTGETPQTLNQGFMVPVKVMALRGKIAHCILDSGLEGMIYVDNISDDRVMNVADVVQSGQTINCKVLRIDKEKFVVELSSKASDTKPDSDLSLRKLPEDPYYDYQEEKRELDRRKMKQRKQAKTGRYIRHPLFQQFNHRQAEEFLADRQRGDLVIRPSSRGFDHIAITWKVDDGVYQHVDVLELRSGNDYNSPAKLKIGEQVFEDLDELIVTYVEAIAKKVQDLVSHPKYRPGGYKALQEHLAAFTRANPTMSAYGFCMNEKPGYFDLGFKLSAQAPPSRWVIKVLPDGYRLRDTSYPIVDALINGFKRLQASEARRRQHR
ncbi:Transcription elongation factor spt6 [Apophysomyces sp. BC1034]|nr:Transcription elongation factor spt6 [Apophysomyces sp. BC1015]KAG0176441.1 Transcription elongation factor spt6 [Apophysomyces sp. BC1021]KAG0186813.1 Transcription elongation factor spt6 [Apophysomyces sp. BC1034]